MVFDTYIEVLSSFVPLIISFSLPPITIRSVLCRARSSTILLVMLGSVEALQKRTVYPLRDRVGELCSLLFLCCQPHLFQVCYSYHVLNTALNISSSRTGPSSYDTQYAQPRSSPSRFMLNNSFYTQWPNSNNCMDPSFNISSNLMEAFILVALSLPESTFVPNYEPQDRYGVQSSYPTYVPPRLSPPILQGPTDSRRLPSLSTTSAAGGDRWQQSLPSNCATAGIRSPTASYPTYASYPSGGGAYTYLPANNLDMNTGLFDLEPQVRPSSPGLYRTPVVDSSSTSPAPPISPTTTAEQPNIKPKRQRATEEQRSILEETWKRTPFPSTEERNALAKRTGMPQRRIQIW